ncbi:MAG: DNA polymerase III subunit beta, partial [Firmicutes bacterium]|nr:DNA polymerase III subunit beta [Bacillota bacterium]
MKLTCNGNDLSAAVGQVYKAVSTKTLNPLLEGILITAENGALTMLATDLEIAIERVIPADVKIEGKTVVPGRFFAEFVKKLTNERIELSLADSKLKIRYTDSQGFLQCMSADEYPSVKELTDAQKFTIVRSELKDLIQKIAFAVSLDDTRPLLKGVLLEVEDATLTGVALDGYRLAKCVKQIEKTTALMRVVVPARSIAEIARILDDSQDFVEVSVQKNHLSIHLNHTKITTQLLDGDYL